MRRRNRDLPWGLDLRFRAAVGRLGSGAARLRMVAAFAGGRHRAYPRQCALAGRRLDFESVAQTPGRPPRRCDGAPRHVVAVAGAIGARRYRRQVLSTLLAWIVARDPLFALFDARYSRWRAAAAGADRALLCLALPRQPGAAHPHRHAQALRRAAAANSSRRRTYLAHSRRADRVADRPAAAAAALCRREGRAAAIAVEWDGPHDADAALLPARRRQLRAVQGHEQRAIRSAGDLACL